MGEAFVEIFLLKSEQFKIQILFESEQKITDTVYTENNCVQYGIENLLGTEMIFLVLWKMSCCLWKYHVIVSYLLQGNLYNAKKIHLRECFRYTCIESLN